MTKNNKKMSCGEITSIVGTVMFLGGIVLLIIGGNDIESVLSAIGCVSAFFGFGLIFASSDY